MTDSLIGRGYDDSAALVEMADGLITRRYSSVDEAAKTVLCEDGGSNVDRLRRKFREQNWYEKGLEAYVERELEKRRESERGGENTVAPQGLSDAPVHSLFGSRLASQIKNFITPTGPYAFVSAFMCFCLVLQQIGIISGATTSIISGAIALFSLLAWSDGSARRATKRKALLSLGGIAAGTALCVLTFGIFAPDRNYSVGSLAGAIFFAVGWFVCASYLHAFVVSRAKKEGRGHLFEVKLAGGAIVALGCLGSSLLAVNLAVGEAKVNTAYTVYSEVQKASTDLQLQYPTLKTKPLADSADKVIESILKR